MDVERQVERERARVQKEAARKGEGAGRCKEDDKEAGWGWGLGGEGGRVRLYAVEDDEGELDLVRHDVHQVLPDLPQAPQLSMYGPKKL